MTFNKNVQLDTSQVSRGGSRRRFPGGVPVGGGIGGLLLLVLVLVFGGDVVGGDLPDPGGAVPGQGNALDRGQVDTAGQQPDSDISQCRTGADANRSDECRVVATVNSNQAYWAALLPQYGRRYTPARTILYSGVAQSACGPASSQVGPFYCPLDSQVYLDTSFYTELTRRFGADSGALAREYVVAHEYGHHVQNLLGLLDRGQRDPQGPSSGSVRTELMADCLAGTWVRHASATRDANGTTFLKPITPSDLESALSAAAAVGDDRIQQAAQERVTPETWTHGSSQSRQQWFLTGYGSGDINQCNTFGAATL